MNNRTHRFFIGLTPYLLFTSGLSICMFLLLHRLGHTYIAEWDEVVHVNVAHNLYADCCDPKLHSIDLRTDFEDTGDHSFKKGEIAWNNNYIWLHKPLLPFYLRAALYHAFGESLFVFRLPSALFALLTAVSLFFIATRLSSIWVATGIALLFASNPFLFELVQGREFSDLSDVMGVFFLTIVLGLTLVSAAGRPLFFLKRDSPAAYCVASLAAALFSALAYSCKGGLALPGLAVFAIALVWQCGWRRGMAHIIVLVLVFGTLVFPESFYFSHRFPQEFRYEQRQQIAHLFTDVEGWARPWHYYITVYWQDLLGLPLGVLGFLAMMTSFLPKLRNRRNVLLVLWVLIYLVPLSFGVSKVANFIVPVLPAVILLVGFSAYDLLQSERRTLLYPLSGVVVLVVVLDHFNILHVLMYATLILAERASYRFLYVTLALADRAVHRFLLLAVSLGILLVSRLLSAAGKGLGLAPPSVSPRVAVVLVALMCFSVIIQNSKSNWNMSNSLPENYEEQLALKATADRIKRKIPKGAVVLVDETSAGDHRNDHLYFQYWSGVNSLPAQQLAFAKRTLSRTHPLYILVKDSLANATLIGKVPYGYLYRID